MTSILSLMIITLLSGETLPPRLMLSHTCRIQMIQASDGARSGGLVTFDMELDEEHTLRLPIAYIECKPFRLEAGA